MSNEDLLEQARNVDSSVRLEDIQALSGGYSSQAYLISTQSPFVLLLARPGGVSSTNYGHAFVVLTLLIRHGFPFSPKPLWLSPNHSSIALEYFRGEPADKFVFNDSSDAYAMSLKVIDALLDTAAITQAEYAAVAAEFSVVPLPVETGEKAAISYGTKWFEIVQKSCPDADVVAWLEPKIQECVIMSKKMSTQEPKLSHGDPSNPNILIRDPHTFMLIDWDSARFQTAWAAHLITYTTNLTTFMMPYRDQLVSHVSERIGISHTELEEQILEDRRFTEVFDVNWAAMMMAKVQSGIMEGDMEKFRSIARERMTKYDAAF